MRKWIFKDWWNAREEESELPVDSKRDEDRV